MRAGGETRDRDVGPPLGDRLHLGWLIPEEAERAVADLAGLASAPADRSTRLEDAAHVLSDAGGDRGEIRDRSERR